MAVEPLWQELQLPVTLLWSNLPPLALLAVWLAQLLVVWHSAQLLEEGIWFADLPGAVPPLWQAEHSRGVFLNTPFAWHLAQSTDLCAPVKGKRVELWSNSPFRE